MVVTVKLRVAREHIKTVKTALQSSNKLIHPLQFEHARGNGPSLITAILELGGSCAEDVEHDEYGSASLLESLHLQLIKTIQVVELTQHGQCDVLKAPPASSQAHAITNAISSWLHQFRGWKAILNAPSHDELLHSANASRYQVYPPMLLFSTGAFSSPSWRLLLADITAEASSLLWQCIANAVGVTHVAINAPILPQLAKDINEDNTIRSPTNLQPLYGDFGPLVAHSPSEADFEAAFWVSAVQNGIKQVWAPRYTMFSRGNIVEKTRLLQLPSVVNTVSRSPDRDGRGCAAVDLYAGIGYFAFSYVKAGVSQVLCFDINPWSIEGLRRGAEANKWSVSVVEDVLLRDYSAGLLHRVSDTSIVRLLAFLMPNERAGDIVERHRYVLPPVRHVNCGLLPSSKQSWETAVKILDPQEGGWIHVHQNLAVQDIDDQSTIILREFEALGQKTKRAKSRPVLESIQRVKTYAPGVMHCVLDIYIPPSIAAGLSSDSDRFKAPGLRLDT